jgi:glycosyltransferase involved in cell wall biosynthesis
MTAPIMLDAFGESAVVYDCMDELSAFRYAPAELQERERLLLSHADVVFTGGPGLYEAKAQLHPNVFCFGCGVEAEHFSAARRPETIVPSDLATLPKPVLGYVGVIDERLDYPLLAHLAAARAWSVVLVGPIAKVSPDELPSAPNLHVLGIRPYPALPSYLKGFDVCLMPFAQTPATRHINPTKTLEYMAAGRPIVSTPIEDVARQFSGIVRLAAQPDAFRAACQMELTAPDPDRMARGVARAATASWESIVCRMSELVDASLHPTALIGA